MAVQRPPVSQAASSPDTRAIEFGAVTVTAVRTASLGNWSYLIASDGDAVLVDPQRDVDRFLTLAEGGGSRVTHVIETHIHSDYLSGGLALSDRTGATILAAAQGRYEFPHTPVEEGKELAIGGMLLGCLATPGHTFEHLAWELRDADSGTTLAILSGGSMLRSGAGRTDLSGDDATSELTRMQYESIRRLSTMADGSLLLPTHDGGSTCSIGIVSADGMPWWDLPSEPEEFPTIGAARDANTYLGLADADEFVRDFLRDRGPAPAYFPHIARLNREGPPLESGPAVVRRLPASAFAQLAASGAWVVDVRNRWMFADEHIPGSLNIEANDAFAVHVGSLVPYGAPVVVVAEEREADLIDDLAVSLFRIGYRLDAVLEKSIEGWSEAGYPTTAYPSVDMMEVLAQASHGSKPDILDVREPSEWANGVIPGSRTVSVAGLEGQAKELQGARSAAAAEADVLTVACHGGARAAVAASYLARLDIPVRAVLGGGVPDAVAVREFTAARS